MRRQRSARPPWQAASDTPPLRYPVELKARLQEHLSCPLDVVVKDLALTEVRLWAGFRLEPGHVAYLLLPGLAPLKCRVAWSRDWHAALLLDRPVHLAVLRQFAARYPPDPGRPSIDWPDGAVSGTS